MRPRVVIIVLNWNGMGVTLDCLVSVKGLDYPNYEVVVVDNGSTDGSVEKVRMQFPGALLIENGQNLGFTGGNNVGLRYALSRGADYALLLNNDTEVAPDLLSHLVGAAEDNRAVGIAGPTIYYHQQGDRIWTSGGAIDWRRGETSMLGQNEVDSGQFGSAPRGVDFVTGCALLVSRTVMEQVGLLDERFFAYYEEAEWCVRAGRVGLKVVHVPAAKVWHKIPMDARDSSPFVHYYMTRNRLLFLKVTRCGWQAWIYTLFQYTRTIFSWTLKPRWRHKRLHRLAMFRAIADAGRGCWGQQARAAGRA